MQLISNLPFEFSVENSKYSKRAKRAEDSYGVSRSRLWEAVSRFTPELAGRKAACPDEEYRRDISWGRAGILYTSLFPANSHARQP